MKERLQLITWIKKFIILKQIGIDNRDKEVRNQVSKAFNFWNTEINKKHRKYFNFLLSKTTYFSEKKVKSAFEIIFGKEKNLKEKGLFLPLRHEERLETSISLIVFIKASFKIDKDRIPIERSCLKSLVVPLQESTDYIKKLQDDLELNNNEIEVLKEEIKRLSKAKVYKKIDSLKKEKKDRFKRADTIKKTIEKINRCKIELEDKNIIFIDDFLCSGKSTKAFIEKNKEEIRTLRGYGYQFYILYLSVSKEGKAEVDATIRECFNEDFNAIKIIPYTTSININEAIKKKFHEDNTFRLEVNRINEEFDLKDSAYNPKTALASFISSPNSNYAFFTQRGKNNKWIPAFPRENKLKKNTIKDRENLIELLRLAKEEHCGN